MKEIILDKNISFNKDILNNKTIKNFFQSKAKKINTKQIFKITIIFTMLSALSFLFVSNFSSVMAYATIEDITALKTKNPNLFNKLKDAIFFYKDSIDILDVANDKELFVKIIQEYLNNFERTL